MSSTVDLDFERKHAEDLERLRGFRLLDDDFMNKVFEDKACAEFLLQIILQRNDKGAGVKRARYNSSLIDANVTEPGDEYEKLNETYVIFITENDVLGGGQPIYHIDRAIKETGALFGDESHIIYVNSQIKGDTVLGRLMHDFSCTKADDMHYPILAEKVRYFKENVKGVAIMCKAMEDMRKNERIEIALRMLKMGKYTYEDIADIVQMTVDEIKALDKSKPA